MKTLIFGLLALLVSSFQEPLPITAEETQDEVAQAQRRAVWITCLDLASARIESNSALIRQKAEKKSVPVEKVVKKYSTGLVLSCSTVVEYSTAEKYLAGEESSEVETLKNKDFGDFLLNESDNFELTLDEKTFLDHLLSEANRKNDGFDQEPPVVPEVVNYQDNRLVYVAVAGVFVVLLVVFVGFGGSSQETKTRDKSPGKKKRE